MISLKDIFISEQESIKNALKRLSKTAKKVLLVINEDDTLLGTISDGDIRRYILEGKSIENDIKEVYNKHPISIQKTAFSMNLAKDIFLDKKITLIPIVDNKNRVVDFVSWEQLFSGERTEVFPTNKLNIPVVIMAGGKGTRLDPFTRILPKPLIPIGDTPIIEIIINEFKKHGVDEFFLTLNHKKEMIEAYFNSIEKDYKVTYIKEDGFWGTAGSLTLLEGVIGDVFIVSNCDVIVKANYKEIVDLHIRQKAALTVISSVQHHKVPYGIVSFREEGRVTNIREKPEYTFTINTGVYVLSREALQVIPKKTYFDMTDLIRVMLRENKSVVTYPVNEDDYIDIGQWGEYKKATEIFSRLGII